MFIARIRVEKTRFFVPLPFYVLNDTLAALEEPFSLLAPLLRLPNYPAALRELLSTLNTVTNEPLVEVQTNDVNIRIEKHTLGGPA